MIDLISSAPAWLGYAMIVAGVAMLVYAALWLITRTAHRPHTPYAPRIDGTGSKPEAPWVTRDEFEAEKAVTLTLHKRLAALEAKEIVASWRRSTQGEVNE